MLGKKYRQSVVGVFVNIEGKVLLGERSDAPGSWQMPQGGVEAGENPEAGLRREMREEIGTNAFQIIRWGEHQCRYEFPADLPGNVAKKYRGQEQTWFLLQFDLNAGPDLAQSDREFSAFRWELPAVALDGIIDWKRDCYEQGFKSIGIPTK